MRMSLGISLAAALAAMALGAPGASAMALGAPGASAMALGAPGASAPQEIGNRCVADAARADATMIGLTNGGDSPLLQTQVLSSGVITRWKVQAVAGIAPTAQRLVVFQKVGEEEERKVQESALETVGPGTNEFRTRIPAPEHAHIGLQGPDGTLFCDEESGNAAGLVEGSWPLGEVRRFSVEIDDGVPAIAIVEPDRDGDGYGDETQEGCPQATAVQARCPPLELNVERRLRRRAILVAVRANAPARVEVFGEVRWGIRAKRGRAGDDYEPRLIVGLDGGHKDVVAGKVAHFRAGLPRPVLRRLERIPPREFLEGKLTVRATDSRNRVTTRTLTLRLKGRDG